MAALKAGMNPDVGVRADVILLCADKLAVLEFKDLDSHFENCEKQVLKYKNRLQKWHAESTGMDKKGGPGKFCVIDISRQYENRQHGQEWKKTFKT